MRNLRAACLAIGLLSISIPCFSQDGRYLLRVCEVWEGMQSSSTRSTLPDAKDVDVLATAIVANIQCPTYLLGLVHGMTAADSSNPNVIKSKWCLPESFRESTLVFPILAYLRANRSQLDLPASRVAAQAIEATFRCKDNLSESKDRNPYVAATFVDVVDDRDRARFSPNTNELAPGIYTGSSPLVVKLRLANNFDVPIVDAMFLLRVFSLKDNALVRSYPLVTGSRLMDSSSHRPLLLEKGETREVLAGGFARVMNASHLPADVRSSFLGNPQGTDESDPDLIKHRAIVATRGKGFRFEITPARVFLGDGTVLKCDNGPCK